MYVLKVHFTEFMPSYDNILWKLVKLNYYHFIRINQLNSNSISKLEQESELKDLKQN